MTPPLDLTVVILPQGVKYDGIQPDETETIGDQYQFTIIDKKSRAHTGTFYLPAKGITSVSLARKAAEFRLSFAAPSLPLPPIYQRQPRIFCATDAHHY